jgi:hypothetical protein
VHAQGRERKEREEQQRDSPFAAHALDGIHHG